MTSYPELFAVGAGVVGVANLDLLEAAVVALDPLDKGAEVIRLNQSYEEGCSKFLLSSNKLTTDAF